MPPTPAPRRRYSWDDYRSWDDDARWELIDGEAYAMTPAPSVRHQWVVRALGAVLYQYFKRRPCDVFLAPTDVKLADDTVVQPDLFVVCDRSKLKDTHVDGAPTLVVEILSPGSIIHDRLRKKTLYARIGVKECWIITPYPSLVEVHVLDGETYRDVGAYAPGDTLASPAFPELGVVMDEVFDFPPQEGDDLIQLVREGVPPGARTRDEYDGASVT